MVFAHVQNTSTSYTKPPPQYQLVDITLNSTQTQDLQIRLLPRNRGMAIKFWTQCFKFLKTKTNICDDRFLLTLPSDRRSCNQPTAQESKLEAEILPLPWFDMAFVPSLSKNDFSPVIHTCIGEAHSREVAYWATSLLDTVVSSFACCTLPPPPQSMRVFPI